MGLQLALITPHTAPLGASLVFLLVQLLQIHLKQTERDAFFTHSLQLGT